MHQHTSLKFPPLFYFFYLFIFFFAAAHGYMDSRLMALAPNAQLRHKFIYKIYTYVFQYSPRYYYLKSVIYKEG